MPGRDVFASAGLPGRSLARRLVAEAKFLRPSASIERAKRAPRSGIQARAAN